MNKFLNYSIILSFGTFMFACSSEDDIIDQWIEDNDVSEVPTSGTLDVSNYVAVGNSLTAGFADAALYPEGQENSFPSILATQFALAGGGDFAYPAISSGNGFGGLNGTDILGKSFIDLETALAALAGVPGAEIGDAIQFTEGDLLTSVSASGLNNFGVPGARVVDLAVNGYGALNPYYGAFQSSAAASVLEDAAGAGGSFFTLWIGSNDVLGYAIDGGAAGEAFDPFNPATLTDATSFTLALQATLDALSASGAEGVILNVPPVTIIPFFQTVTQLGGGINLIPLDAATAAATQAAYDDAATGYNPGLAAAIALGIIDQAEADLRTITWVEGANPPVITDESLTTADISAAFALPAGSVVLPNLRQAIVDPLTGGTDLFPLTALEVIGVEAVPGDPTTTYGVGLPVPDESTLTLDEQVNAITAYATFNAIIAGEVAARSNLTLVDVGPAFADLFGLSAAQAAGLQLSMAAQAAADGELGTLVGGFNLEPLSLTAEGIFNSVWSTDGVHPNPRGNAIIVNEIIEALNAKYEASIPTVNVLDFPSINAPF